jgi:hypothetical protein
LQGKSVEKGVTVLVRACRFGGARNIEQWDGGRLDPVGTSWFRRLYTWACWREKTLEGREFFWAVKGWTSGGLNYGRVWVDLRRFHASAGERRDGRHFFLGGGAMGNTFRVTFASMVAVAGVCAVIVAPARAAQSTFNIFADGIKEVSPQGVPGQGDLDGTAIGTVVLNNGTGAGNTGSATINLTLSNIDLTTLLGHHIHQAPATTTGSIVLDFGDPDTIRTGSVLNGTITGLPAATITNALANPPGFYYNIHNGPFPGGAVRDQLVPEPGVGMVLLVGACGLLRRRERASA